MTVMNARNDRGACPTCGRTVRLKSSGGLYSHTISVESLEVCSAAQDGISQGSPVYLPLPTPNVEVEGVARRVVAARLSSERDVRKSVRVAFERVNKSLQPAFLLAARTELNRAACLATGEDGVQLAWAQLRRMDKLEHHREIDRQMADQEHDEVARATTVRRVHHDEGGVVSIRTLSGGAPGLGRRS